MEILNTLAPVFLLIALGAGLQRAAFVPPNFLKEANRVTYWVGLPALLFSQLAASFHQSAGAGRMLGVMLVATGAVIVAAYAGAWLLRVPGAAAGTFVQGAFRGNLAFVGLPVIYALPDTPLAGGLSVRTAAIVTIAPMMVLYNVAGVVVLLLSQHTLGWRMVGPLLRQLAVTPPLLATIAGLGWALLGWPLPVALDRTFSALGQMALPLGLILSLLMQWLFCRVKRVDRLNKGFRRGQLISAAAYSLGHGGNDAQKTMGIILAVLIASGKVAQDADVPLWVVLAAHSAIALGTLSGGWRIVKTMGSKITRLQPSGGMAAETGAALTLFYTSHAGIPVSTTHTITGAIVGVGASRRLSAVRWTVAGRVVVAWVVTIPGAGLVAAIASLIVQAVAR